MGDLHRATTAPAVRLQARSNETPSDVIRHLQRKRRQIEGGPDRLWAVRRLLPPTKVVVVTVGETEIQKLFGWALIN